MSAMAMAQAGGFLGTPVDACFDSLDFLDDGIESVGGDEAWLDSIHEWAAICASPPSFSSVAGTKTKQKEGGGSAAAGESCFKKSFVVPTIKAVARPQGLVAVPAARSLVVRAEAAALHLAEAKSATATADERARALRAYQRLTLSAAEYRRTVAIPLRKEKRLRVDWEKSDRVMYYSRKVACHERKRTEMGRFVPKRSLQKKKKKKKHTQQQ